MNRAVVLAYGLLVLGGVLGYILAKGPRVNIRALHNSFAAVMALIVGLGLIKHTKKLISNEKDVLAWGHFVAFALFMMLVVWILVHHNRILKKKTPEPKKKEADVNRFPKCS